MAWTTPRTWVTGEVVTAAEMNAHVRDNTNALNDRIQVVSKLSDQNVTSNTVLANDADLKFTVVSGQTYVATFNLYLSSGTQLADLKLGFTFPSGTFNFGALGLDTTATAPNGSPMATTAITAATSGTSTVSVAAGGTGLVVVSVQYACTANGTVQLQWAQATSSATAVTLKQGSCLQAIRQAV